MKYILIVGPEQMVVGPFESTDDAYSYAINVLDSVSYSVQQIQQPISVKNHRLLAEIAA